jgi:hypothetical protein
MINNDMTISLLKKDYYVKEEQEEQRLLKIDMNSK